MTEAKWLTCKKPEPMLKFLRGKASDRKLRLFAAACCRRIWNMLKDPLSRQVVETSERFADGLASWEEFHAVVESAWQPPAISWWARSVNGVPFARDGWRGQAFRVALLASNLHLDVDSVGQLTREILLAIQLYPYRWDSWFDWGREPRAQCALLRHLIGNPFRPVPVPGSWSSTVTALAATLYDGEDCHYALADALMEVGHVELAEHFQEPGHPKGCWALDAILGKQ